jgi:hypothetical protein
MGDALQAPSRRPHDGSACLGTHCVGCSLTFLLQWLFELVKRPVGWKWTKNAEKLEDLVSSDKGPLRIWSFDANDVLPESTATIRFDRVDSLDDLVTTS